jgi:hypothetical protein
MAQPKNAHPKAAAAPRAITSLHIASSCNGRGYSRWTGYRVTDGTRATNRRLRARPLDIRRRIRRAFPRAKPSGNGRDLMRSGGGRRWQEASTWNATAPTVTVPAAATTAPKRLLCARSPRSRMPLDRFAWAADDCVCFAWATNQHLAIAIDVMHFKEAFQLGGMLGARRRQIQSATPALAGGVRGLEDHEVPGARNSQYCEGSQSTP